MTLPPRMPKEKSVQMNRTVKMNSHHRHIHVHRIGQVLELL